MYIGWTSRALKTRWCQHLSDSKKYNYYFYRAIRKYGKENFQIEIIEKMSTEVGAKKAEKVWIKELNTFGENGYNSTAGGDGTCGHTKKLSVEHINALRKANKGKKRSEEHKKIISATHKGRKHSVQTRTKISIARLGKPSPNKDKKFSEEIRKNMKIGALKRDNLSDNKLVKRIAAKKFIGIKRSHNFFAARCSYMNKEIHIGCFKTEIEAAIAYDKYIIENNYNKMTNKMIGMLP